MLGRHIADLKALIKLLRQHKKHSKTVRVGFLCQYVPAWSKAEPIYRAMLADPDFSPTLICLPSGIRDHELVDPAAGNDTYDYYISHGYPAINALQPDGWLDITKLGLDWLICLRPYDFYLPRCYHSGVLAKHMKLCLVQYGTMLVREDEQLQLDPAFMRNVSLYFAENEDTARTNRKNLPLGHRLGLQKSLCVGIPSMAQVQAERDAPCDAWDFTPGKFRVMWTPRWTTEPKLGGTNFFHYREFMLEFAQANPDAACLFRPHPMAFDNFVAAGEMTPGEVEDYKQRIGKLPNVQLDTRQDFIRTMWHSTALVSDYSGILVEYLFMDKPIVFCKSNMLLTPNGFLRRMLQACYVVNDKKELAQTLAMLKGGEDPLRQTRTQIRRELFGQTADTVIHRILEELR